MRQRLMLVIALAGIALVGSAAALAGTLTATATVTGTSGISLTVPASASVSTTLDGSDQTVSYAPLLALLDARGSGAGWNLQISATAFDDGLGHTLAPGVVSAAAQACHSGSSCTAAVNSGITLPLTVTSSAVKFFNAAASSGLGKIDVTPTVGVVVPGNSYAGTYTSTVTIVAAVGP
jgi:hypothetical protein